MKEEALELADLLDAVQYQCFTNRYKEASNMIRKLVAELNKKPLSDEEILELKTKFTKVPSKPWSGIPMAHFDVIGFARAIEERHGIK